MVFIKFSFFKLISKVILISVRHIGQIPWSNNLFIQLPQKKCLHGNAIIDFLFPRHIGHIVPSSPYPSTFIAPLASFIFLKFSSLFFSLIFLLALYLIYFSSNIGL